MNSKQKVSLATPKLPPEIQREVDELRRVFSGTEKYLRQLEVAMKSAELSNQARKEGNNLLMQKGHDVKTHRETFKRYSQSIAFAPPGSEELVLGYGNRSALLMHLQHYEEALLDIEKALQLSKSEEYKKKMQDRKEKCLGLLNEQNLIKSTKYMSLTENKELEKISKVENFTPSATVESAADCVGVSYNDQFGRHLVATRDINPGEIVIVEKGYACSPILSELFVVCSHCSQYAWNGIPCDECVYAIYCSEDCKNEAHKEYHDIECPILMYMHPIIFNSINGVPVVTTIRLFITALRKEGFVNVMKEISAERKEESCEALLTDGILKSDFKACYNLSPWLKDVGTEFEELEFNILRILYLLIHHTNFVSLLRTNSSADKTAINLLQPVFYDDNSVVIDPCLLLKFKKALLRLKSIASTNGYPIHIGTTQCDYCNDFNVHMKRCQLMSGITIVPCCSLINHSCTPNLSYLSTPKRKFIAFSTCPIKKGEMLCASYKSVNIFFGDVKTRKMILRSFTCKCRACLDNINTESFMNEREKDMRKLQVELKKTFSASVANSYTQTMIHVDEISEKTFQEMTKISHLIYKHFNYYKAFAHSVKSICYIETTIAKLYKEKIYMPNDC